MGELLSADDELCRRAQERWQVCQDILDTAMDQIHSEFVKVGVDEDIAYNLVLVLMLHEIFLHKTVQAAVDRDEDDDVLKWIEIEYKDWDRDRFQV